MPANLTPQYMEAEEALQRAITPEEKLDALEEMLRAIPKHKGTEKMQADIKRRIARLREASEAARKKGKADPYRVEREGAGQVFVVGPPNSGRSSDQSEGGGRGLPVRNRMARPGHDEA